MRRIDRGLYDRPALNSLTKRPPHRTALHWLKDTLPGDGDRIRKTLARLLGDPKHGDGIRNDLTQGFSVLPAMQSFLRTIPGFDPMPSADPPDPAKAASRRRPSPACSTPAVSR
ncbi:hypothetical protein [Variovorax sp. Root411]|uniref:hypothetical protein n=1 Tax=Variovorax sp. Root411 TaxID=1736530 RepID=UPI0006F5BA3C|nr:hypothetical protein [Variovorax sp. Root411]KQW54448.1 hypothetical protein ASC92_20735 [Variovorax sp. Root411]